MAKTLSIAIVGAGIGGMAAAATLRQAGIDVRVYEQAPRFARIGAGIQMMPNSMKVLRRIGVEERVRRAAFQPYSHLNREWDTGKVMRELPMPESLFGAPYLCMHRAELHDALLAAAIPGNMIHLDKKLVGMEQNAGQVTLDRSPMERAPTRTLWSARTAFIPSCATSSLVPMSPSTKDASLTAPFFRRLAQRHGDRTLANQMVGARIATS